MTAVGRFLQRHGLCIIWGSVLAFWTWALISHQPVETGREVIPENDHFYVISKCLHAGMYALLTATSGLLGARGWTRFLFPAGMVLHGMLTELIQYCTEQWLHRHGCVEDVAIDTAGVVLGLAAGWLLGWWRWSD